ncbi:VCBS repeat-containing protein [Bradyrhizobium sp. USDA 4449]
MNYAGKFDAALSLDGQGFRLPASGHVVPFTANSFTANSHTAGSYTAKAHGHVPDGAVVVADPNLIFHGDFKRTGLDLVLSHDGHAFVVHDYFRGDKRAAIASADGAHLTGDIVSALTGYVQYAQAAPGAAAAQVIGHVTKLTGSATAIRNGVSVVLNNGDNVEKGDVVSTGSDSTLGVTFIDGTVFGLSSNARMVLNEMVYDPNGSNNSSLLSLVAGTITFVAGETAKHGDMKIDTPVATMGIRGTAVLTEINFVVPAGGGDPQPQANFQVLVEPNGTTGSYILFDKLTLLPIATVNQAGQMIQISGGNVSVTNALLSPDVQKLITDVFTLKFTDNNTNTKLTTNFTDTVTQTSDGLTIKTPAGYVAIPVFVNLSQQNAALQGPTDHATAGSRVPNALSLFLQSLDLANNVKLAFNLTEVAGQTGVSTADLVIAKASFVDFNLGDRPTVKVVLTDGTYVYQDSGQHDVTAGLSALQKQDILATEVKITVVPGAGNDSNGTAAWTFSVPDSAFDFLAAGETLTLKYTIVLNNNFADDPGIVTKDITITIAGTNDKPVITSAVPTITFSGGTSVPGGPLTTDVPTSGTLSFSDVDLTDTHTVAVSKFSAVLPGGTVPQSIYDFLAKDLSVSIAPGHDSTGSGTGTVNWSLGDIPVYLADFIPKGEVLTLTYTVTVTDSQGATSDQTITVTVTGTDAPAVVWIATNKPGAPSGGFWGDGANWETGTVPTSSDDVIVITDQLHGLTPSYPVTIDTAAFAKSLTMNDFDTKADHTAPEVINKSTLTITGTLTLEADSRFTNQATGIVSVGGKAEFSGASVLANAGGMTLAGGGDFAEATSITNSGTIELSGGTLTTLAEIHNAGGILQADVGTRLIVGAATVDGGAVTIYGTLELDGTSLIENGTLSNCGVVNVRGAAEFSSETVANKAGGLIEVWSDSALTIDHGSVVKNSGNLTVDADGKLIVNGATIDGGTLTISGTLESTGSSGITGVDITNTGTVTVDGMSKLHLTDVSINGGSLNNFGNLYAVSGGNNVTGAVTNTGIIEVQAGTLNLSGKLTGAGQLIIDDEATLELGGADAQTVTFSGGSDTLQLDNTSHGFTGTITGQATSGGSFAITGNADVTASEGDALDFTASGGSSDSRGDIVLTPSGTLTGANNGIAVTQNGIGTISLITVGDVTGTAGEGITLRDGATGAGDIAATIGGTASGAVGLDVLANRDGDVTITNHGHIIGTGSYGISVVQDGDEATGSTHITNTGSVAGAGDVAAISIHESATGTATIDNSGTIGRDDAGSVTATAYAIVETGGAVAINNSGHINGNISAASATFDNESAGTWIVSGTNAFGTSSTIDNAGEIDLHDGASVASADGLTFGITNSGSIESWGTTSITGSITNTNTIEIHAGGALSLFGSLSGSGSVTIDAGATLVLDATMSQTVTFAGEGSELSIQTTDFGGSIAGLIATDKIDLSSIGYGLGTSAIYVANDDAKTGGTLTITDAAGHHISLALTGADYSNTIFAGSDDGTGHTLITVNAADDAPKFTADGAGLSASFSELANTTNSPAPDPVPAAAGSIAFTDVDLTDRPQANVPHQDVTWLDADGHTELTPTSGQASALESALAVLTSGKNNGAVDWSYSIADGALDFLGQGQTATVVSTIALDDGHHGTDTTQVTVTITGANDAPAITTGAGDVDTVTLPETNAGLSKGGTLTVSDADATDHVTVALDHLSVYLDGVLQTDGIDGLSNADLVNYLAVQSGDILNGTADHAQFSWDFNSGDQAFDFLAAGHTLSLQYTIVPNDGHVTGTGDVVTVNITGSNDSPMLDDATLTSVAGNDSNPAGSTVSDLFASKFHDVDDGASFQAIAVTSDTATTAEGVWQYEVAGTSQWVDIGSVSDCHALVLGTDTSIRFVPADGFTGTPDALGVQALDDTYGGGITTSAAPVTTDIAAMATDGTAPASSEATTISTSVTAPAGGPLIGTDDFYVSHDRELGTDSILNLSVSDTDSNASADDFTVTAVTAHAPDSHVDPSAASGSLDDINTAFQDGITYNPGDTPPDQDQITLTVTDQTTGAGDTVNFIFNEGDARNGVTLSGTSGKDVIFATTTGDTLSGGGGKDQFVFAPGRTGEDATHTIADFIEGLDKIDLRQFSGVASTHDLHMTQLSGETQVTWQEHIGTGDGAVTEHETLLLKNVVAASLKASDFIFHIS